MTVKVPLKTLLSVSLLLGALLLVFRGGEDSVPKTSAPNIIIHNKKNSANNIMYSFKINNDHVCLSANSVEFIDISTIVLLGVSATYTTDKRKVLIKSQKCVCNTKERNAYLSESVEAVSDGLAIRTTEATVDFQKQSITGDAKVIGSSDNISFECSGFSITKDGQIHLKQAKTKIQNSKKLKRGG
jgi:lipopolysaccharide assembly outer membrane protein LptD (OstA)